MDLRRRWIAVVVVLFLLTLAGLALYAKTTYVLTARFGYGALIAALALGGWVAFEILSGFFMDSPHRLTFNNIRTTADPARSCCHEAIIRCRASSPPNAHEKFVTRFASDPRITDLELGPEYEVQQILWISYLFSPKVRIRHIY